MLKNIRSAEDLPSRNGAHVFSSDLWKVHIGVVLLYIKGWKAASKKKQNQNVKWGLVGEFLKRTASINFDVVVLVLGICEYAAPVLLHV